MHGSKFNNNQFSPELLKFCFDVKKNYKINRRLPATLYVTAI